MLRVRALDRFRRYYYHALRNDKSTEQASDEAMQKMKVEVQAWLDADVSLSEYDKREMWGDIFAHVLDWQMLLTDVTPTAPKELLSKKIDSLDAKEEAEKIKSCTDQRTPDAGRDNPDGH